MLSLGYLPFNSACLDPVLQHEVDATKTLNWVQSGEDITQVNLAVANIWFPWITRGLFMGLRRQFLQTHVDDHFLATTQYNSTKTVRTSGEDLQFQAQHQKVCDAATCFQKKIHLRTLVLGPIHVLTVQLIMVLRLHPSFSITRAAYWFFVMEVYLFCLLHRTDTTTTISIILHYHHNISRIQSCRSTVHDFFSRAAID